MEEWKSLIERGNDLFDRKRDTEAEGAYLHAIARIEQLFDVWLVADEAVGALLASYHNLADLYARSSRYDQACEIFHKVHQRLVGALAKTTDEEVQCALLCGVRGNASALLFFEQQLGLSPTQLFPSQRSLIQLSSKQLAEYAATCSANPNIRSQFTLQDLSQ